VCVLGLFIGAVWGDGLCAESKTRAQAFVAPTEKGHKIAQPAAMRDGSLLVSQLVETTVVEQKQILERGREEVDILAGRPTPIQRSDAAQGEAAQSAPASERKQSLEYAQEWDRAEVLACALTSSLRVLISLRAELEAARTVNPEVAQAAAAEVEQKQALKQERDRAEALARELTSLQAELDTARIAGSQAVQAAEAERKLIGARSGQCFGRRMRCKGTTSKDASSFAPPAYSEGSTPGGSLTPCTARDRLHQYTGELTRERCGVVVG
jgi:hypothetical protein